MINKLRLYLYLREAGFTRRRAFFYARTSKLDRFVALGRQRLIADLRALFNDEETK